MLLYEEQFQPFLRFDITSRLPPERRRLFAKSFQPFLRFDFFEEDAGPADVSVVPVSTLLEIRRCIPHAAER